jgi:hypothetical protein
VKQNLTARADFVARTGRYLQRPREAITQIVVRARRTRSLWSPMPPRLKAAILVFYSLLDEQQRRLFAGLESIKLGRGAIPSWRRFL